MKTSENIYTGVVLAIAGLMLIELVFFQTVLIPRSSEEELVPLWNFISLIFALQAIVLGSTAFLNLRHRTLGTVSTVLQIISLFLSSIGIPFAIWGIVLLVKQNKRILPSSDVKRT